MSKETFYIGVDGGGTKTAYLLVNSSGEIVATHIGKGCNPSSIGEEMATQYVHEGIHTLLEKEGIQETQVARLLLCMAGSRIFWRKMLEKNPPVTTTEWSRAVGDHRPVLELGVGREPGIVLHAGTGSFIVGRDLKGEIYVVGAIGYLLGDPGSGFELGRLAVQRTVLSMQGLRPAGAVVNIVRERFGFSDLEGMVREVYHNPTFVAEAASLAPGVIQLAGEGDPECREIIEEAVTPLLSWASQLIHEKELSNSGKYRSAISGAILRSPIVQEFARPYWESLGHPWTFSEITQEPAKGVAAMLTDAS